MLLFRSICSLLGILIACKIISDILFKSNGFTVIDSYNSFDAPAISLRIKTPSPSTLVATNSLATRFIPSLTGVIMAMSEIVYRSINSSKLIDL